MVFGYRQLVKAAALFALACAVVPAQTTIGIDAFTHEGTLPFANIGAAGQVNIPADVLASIQGRALEIRQNVQYFPSSRLLRVRHYLVAPSAPNPTPSGTQTATIEDYSAAITQVIRTETPPSVALVGTINTVTGTSPFGFSQGLPFIYTFGYDAVSRPASGTTAATSTRFNNLTLVIPARVTTFIANSTGTLIFTGSSTGPGTGTGTGVTARAGSDFSTAASEISLDGSQSTSTNTGALTYRWRAVSGPANLLDPTSARTRVQLGGNFGTYLFELTVTDASGQTGTAQVRVTYSGRF